MRDRILTRMGDGQRIEMSCDRIKEELLTGTRDAAQRAEIPALTPDDLELLFDIFGMPVAHIMAAGMGGIRTAGDLVAWMQMTRKMKIGPAKQYVAQKLGIDLIDLTDEEVMRQIRKDLGIGTITALAGSAKGMAAKWKIAELLDIQINSVNLFRSSI